MYTICVYRCLNCAIVFNCNILLLLYSECCNIVKKLIVATAVSSIYKNNLLTIIHPRPNKNQTNH